MVTPPKATGQFEARLKQLRKERDELVLAFSWLDEPDLIWDALRALRIIEGEIAQLEQP